MQPTLTPSNFFTILHHENILVEHEFDLAQFSFKEDGPVGSERRLTVGVKESWMNLYVNIQKNQKYFTVRRNSHCCTFRYKMCSSLIVSVFTGSSNKMVTRIMSSSLKNS
jgi:hypothetical protein